MVTTFMRTCALWWYVHEAKLIITLHELFLHLCNSHNHCVFLHTPLAENLLLFGRGRAVKLHGFGRAMSADTSTSAVLKDTVHLSTFFCAAPEVVREEVPTTAVDVWSVMCTMVHMITGRWTGCVESPILAVTMLMLVSNNECLWVHKEYIKAVSECDESIRKLNYHCLHYFTLLYL